MSVNYNGFSIVKLVEGSSSKRLYALKKITCHSLEDQRVALSEVEICKQINHPNIIKCIESDLTGIPDIVGNLTSVVFILLPYYKRGTLHDELQRLRKSKQQLEEQHILTMFRSICDGVYYMHSMKPYPLAHRDLKTANILLADDFSPIIMDLGSAAPARVEINGSSDALRLQDEAAEKSSMPYRAPELFTVEAFCKIDERTDVWSLGCMLYAMCFYHSPFDPVYERGDSIALAVISGIIHYPEAHKYSQDMVSLIGRILVVASEDRPFVPLIISQVDQLIAKPKIAV